MGSPLDDFNDLQPEKPGMTPAQQAAFDSDMARIAGNPADLQAVITFGAGALNDLGNTGSEVIRAQAQAQGTGIFQGRLLQRLEKGLRQAFTPRNPADDIMNALSEITDQLKEMRDGRNVLYSDMGRYRRALDGNLAALGLYLGAMPQLLKMYDDVFIPQEKDPARKQALMVARLYLDDRKTVLEGAAGAGRMNSRQLSSMERALRQQDAYAGRIITEALQDTLGSVLRPKPPAPPQP